MFSKEEMRARYWELEDARDEVLSKSGPLRDKMASLKEKIAPVEAEIKSLRDEIIATERPALPEIDQERVMIQKALSGNVGERSVPA